MLKRPDLESNDIQKLWLGSSQDLLKELHILTRDGKLNQDSRRKLKQVYHLIQLIEPLIEKIYEANPNPQIVDVGSGKSYLGFLLYDLLLNKKEGGWIYSVEARNELVQKSEDLAKKSNFLRMKFISSNMQDFKWNKDGSPDLVCALHACDTATDDAIFFGLKNKAKAMALVPCCQAEVSRLLEKVGKSEVSALWDYPLHKREFASHLTNVVRVLTLKAYGYSVTVTELVGWEHSIKNEIILAQKTSNFNKKAERELQDLLEKIPIQSKLIRMLQE